MLCPKLRELAARWMGFLLEGANYANREKEIAQDYG